MKYQITNDSIMVVVLGTPHTIHKSHPHYMKLKEAVLNERWDEIPKYITVEKTLENWSDGEFKLHNGTITYRGEPIPNSIASRIKKALETNDPSGPTRFLRFWERLDLNPSHRSVHQLMSFLQHTDITINDKGFLVAYKGVENNLRDKFSKSFDNSPGQTLSMKRWKVSDDPNVACSEGFHAGARNYAKDFGPKVVIVEIDPQHVVCIPKDPSQQKMRVCEYTVIGLDNGMPLNQENTPSAKNKPDTTHEESTPIPREQQPNVQLPLTGTPYDKYNQYDAIQLLELPLDTLRKYARHNLLIVGASKLPGGKDSLVPAILRARQA